MILKAPHSVYIFCQRWNWLWVTRSCFFSNWQLLLGRIRSIIRSDDKKTLQYVSDIYEIICSSKWKKLSFISWSRRICSYYSRDRVHNGIIKWAGKRPPIKRHDMHLIYLINVDNVCCHAKWWRLSKAKGRGRTRGAILELKFTAASKTLYMHR